MTPAMTPAKDFEDVVKRMKTSISCPLYKDDNSYFATYTEMTFDEVEALLRRVYDVVEKRLGEEKLRGVLRLLGSWLDWVDETWAVQAFSRDVIYDKHEHDSTVELTPRSPPLKLIMRSRHKCYELQLKWVGSAQVVARKYKIDCSEIKKYDTDPGTAPSGTFYKLVKFNIKTTFADAIAEHLFRSDEEVWEAVKKLAKVVSCLPRGSPVLGLIARLRELKVIPIY